MAWVRFRWKKGTLRGDRPRAPRDGRWWVGYRDQHGKERQERSGACSKTEALRSAERLEQKALNIRMGLELGESADITVAEVWAKRWELVVKRQASATSTMGRMENYVLPILGHKKLRLVTPADVDALLNDLEAKLAPATRRQIRTHLTSLFNFAKRKLRVFFAANPAEDAERPALPRYDPEVIEPAHLSKLLDQPGKDRFLLRFAAFTGCRRSELRKLKWTNVSADATTIEIWDAKGHKDRVIAVHPELRGDIQAERRIATSRHVFPGRNGGMRTKSFNAVRKLRVALKKAGLPTHYCFKDFRSTWGTMAVEATGDIKFVQDNLGHSTDRITRQHYMKKRAEHAVLVQVMSLKRNALLDAAVLRRSDEQTSGEGGKLMPRGESKKPARIRPIPGIDKSPLLTGMATLRAAYEMRTYAQLLTDEVAAVYREITQRREQVGALLRELERLGRVGR